LKIGQVYGVGAWRTDPILDRRRYGVPPGGPWDREAASYVRAISGFDRDAPVFELLQGSCEVEIIEDGAIAIAGFQVQINNEEFCGIRPVSNGEVIRVAAHVAYLAEVPRRLPTAGLNWRTDAPNAIRYLPELFEDRIPARATRAFSRSGVRFESEISFPCEERASEPTCVGAIQSTPSGEIIVIGPDGPTIGGYPRLGTVIDADLDLIPRLKTGQSTEFHPVGLDVALEIGESRRKLVESRCAYLRAFATTALG
jgi:allophanate hydrolase subunit 2